MIFDPLFNIRETEETDTADHDKGKERSFSWGNIKDYRVE